MESLFHSVFVFLVVLELRMNSTSKRRVVLFGLSANPPTGLGGHMGIANEFSSL